MVIEDDAACRGSDLYLLNVQAGSRSRRTTNSTAGTPLWWIMRSGRLWFSGRSLTTKAC